MPRPVKVLSISKVPSHIQRYLQIEAVVEGVPVRYTVDAATLSGLETRQQRRTYLEEQAYAYVDSLSGNSMYQELLGDIEGPGGPGKP